MTIKDLNKLFDVLTLDPTLIYNIYDENRINFLWGLLYKSCADACIAIDLPGGVTIDVDITECKEEMLKRFDYIVSTFKKQEEDSFIQSLYNYNVDSRCNSSVD